ncbi:50S ribosomal protein L23 [Metamycoplasma hyosynoviae]|uniref:50S ribosomal protein L23 n=1 Tax=Metamycoplasma hyosynoviae TaxID=29559 RepID=UPI00235E36C1|nr:50S ribosomal protein L23 [Metamycoplasma hyosynoviae]MDD1375049.1 50S ribosomal protein L23 [Metamycoplasma hyosynoviae]
MRFEQVIKYPLITEKSEIAREKGNLYTFVVDKKSNKIEIRQAIEFIFNVKVLSVRIANYDKKPAQLGRFKGFKSAVKKAYVQLDEKSQIILSAEQAEQIKKAAKKLEKETKKQEAPAQLTEAEKKAAEKIKKATKAKVETKPKTEDKTSKTTKSTKTTSQTKELKKPAVKSEDKPKKTATASKPKAEAKPKTTTKKETKKATADK